MSAPITPISIFIICWILVPLGSKFKNFLSSNKEIVKADNEPNAFNKSSLGRNTPSIKKIIVV